MTIQSHRILALQKSSIILLSSFFWSATNISLKYGHWICCVGKKKSKNKIVSKDVDPLDAKKKNLSSQAPQHRIGRI